MDVPDIVKTYVENFSPAGLEVWVETFAPEGTYRDPGTQGSLGKEALRQHFLGLFTGFPDASAETLSLDAISEQVWVWRWILRGTNTGSYRGLPATGKELTLPGCEFIEVRGGKVRSVDGYFDRPAMLAQLGLAPGPAASSPSEG